jgi:hypothetical protein
MAQRIFENTNITGPQYNRVPAASGPLPAVGHGRGKNLVHALCTLHVHTRRQYNRPMGAMQWQRFRHASIAHRGGKRAESSRCQSAARESIEIRRQGHKITSAKTRKGIQANSGDNAVAFETLCVVQRLPNAAPRWSTQQRESSNSCISGCASLQSQGRCRRLHRDYRHPPPRTGDDSRRRK